VILGAVLLTGGTSRRLGTDKAALVIDGTTLARRTAATLGRLGLTAVEVGPGHTDLPAVREDPPGSGPLAGLVAGAAALGETGAAPPDAVLLVACDLPNVEPVLAALVAAPAADLVVPVDVTGRSQYVCARYGADLLVRAGALVDGGERSLRGLAGAVAPARRIELHDLPPDALADIDTPADARRWGAEAPR
jgi:molybdopterin-guanine dinucleotide biosynthesis protein A